MQFYSNFLWCHSFLYLVIVKYLCKVLLDENKEKQLKRQKHCLDHMNAIKTALVLEQKSIIFPLPLFSSLFTLKKQWHIQRI